MYPGQITGSHSHGSTVRLASAGLGTIEL